MDAPAPHCPTLPSSDTAYRFVSGEPGAWMLLVRDWGFRSFLIWCGMLVFGNDGKHTFRNALAGGGAIELFVLWWIWRNMPAPAQQALLASPPPAAAAGQVVPLRSRSYEARRRAV